MKKLIAATSTPIASILGSGFLIIVPVLNGAVGRYAVLAMALVCALAYCVGHAIRFNIKNAEPLLEQDKATKRTTRLERSSDLALGLVQQLLGHFPSTLFRIKLEIGKRRSMPFAVLVFAAGLALAALGILPAAVALVLTVTDYVSLRDIYDAIDWPIILLIGAMLPVVDALQWTGGAELLVETVLGAMGSVHAGWALAVVIVVTLTLSDVINNAATGVVMAPTAVTLAHHLDASPDPFLMAVAVGASRPDPGGGNPGIDSPFRTISAR